MPRISRKSNRPASVAGRRETRVQVLRSAPLASVPWLVHGFSTRAAAFSTPCGHHDLNLGFTCDDSPANVERNRKLYLAALAPGIQRWPLITLRQLHSDLIHRVDSRPEQPLSGDGLITRTPGLLLGIQTADCLPIILADTRQRACGLFHAGWRGTLARMVEKGVGKMRQELGTRLRDLRAAIGPAIHSCCYQVGEEVREQFASQFAYADELFTEVRDSDPVRQKYPLLFLTARPPGHGPLPGKLFLDLVKANREQLISAGVPPTNIWASPLCTACRTDLLFSHRAEAGRTGRMLAVAGVRQLD